MFLGLGEWTKLGSSIKIVPSIIADVPQLNLRGLVRVNMAVSVQQIG
jgi:hypothetical protein